MNKSYDRKSILDLIISARLSVRDIAASHGVSVSTVRRIKAAFTTENERRLREETSPGTAARG